MYTSQGRFRLLTKVDNSGAWLSVLPDEDENRKEPQTCTC
jgi:hypothetical protein